MDQTGDATETGNNDTELTTTNTNEAITDDDKEKANINTIDEGSEDAEQEEQRSPTPEDKGSQVMPQEEEVNKTETEEETRDTFLTEEAEEAQEAEQEQQQEEYGHEEEWEDYSQEGDEKDSNIVPVAAMSQSETQAEPDTKTSEEPTESTNQDSEQKTEETSQSNEAEKTNEEPAKDESTNQESEKTETDASADQKDGDKEEDKKTDDSQKEAVVVAAAAGGVLAKDEMEKKIAEDEDLSNKMESALSNQEAEKQAYQNLVDENVKLRKHHDEMKEKFDEMEGGHLLLQAELETLKKVNTDQKETIGKQENEIKLLKENQGGDAVVKDLQEKLIRLSNEQEEKDKKIHSLEGELDTTKEKLKDAESRAARGGNGAQGDGTKSKTCIVM